MPVRLRLLPAVGARLGEARSPTHDRAIEFDDDAREIRIGRRPDLELPLPYPALSGLHAQLTRADDGWRIEDLGSTNGTRVAGRRIEPRQPEVVLPGTEIALGDVTLVFDGLITATGSEGTASIARRLVDDLYAASPAAAAPILTVISGGPTRRSLRLEAIDRRYIVGRGEHCDLPLPSDEVSREHAAFVRRWDGVVVTDLASKNGVRVNTIPTLELRLRDGDLVELGPITVRVSDPSDRYLRELEGKRPDAPPPQPFPQPVTVASTAPVATLEGDDPSRSAPPVEGVVALVPEAAPEKPAASEPQPRARGSRTAIAVAAAVLLAVAAGVLALVFGR
jgi:pSer/pThr/pTyr-binding forkhead associated (FHA) protein